MPKIIEYPRASLKKSIELATAVDELGGSCNKETCAEKIGKKVSGGFLSLVGAASKFGLISVGRGNLTVTQQYNDLKLSYNQDERIKNLRKIFFTIPLYRKIYEQYKGVKLPVEILSKILIREFGVPEKISVRISGYFIDAAKMVKLLKTDNTFESIITSPALMNTPVTPSRPNITTDDRKVIIDAETPEERDVKSNYEVRIRGPNINTVIEIDEEDHFMIVETILKTIKKKFTEEKKGKEKSSDQ